MDQNFLIPEFKIKNLIYDSEMQSEWYKDPYVSCVFKSVDDKNFIIYPKSDFTIKICEIIFKNDSEINIMNEVILDGFNNHITLIKHYLIKNEDFIFSACSDNLLIWKYNINKFILFNKINVRGGFIYNSILFNDNLIAVTSYEENFPIKIYNLNGDFIKDISNQGKGFYIQNLIYNKKTFFIIGNWNSTLSLYDYNKDEYVMNMNLLGNVKNGFVNRIEENLIYFTIIDWRGNVMQIDLLNGIIVNQKIRIAINSPALCNYIDDKIIIINGKNNTLEFINSDSFESLKSLKNVHQDKLIINIWKFKLDNFGEVLITYGFDKRINILY